MIPLTIKLTDLEQKRKELLDSYALKQSFRVSIGRSEWIEYKDFNPAYNLRVVLNDEVVIEFDMPKDYIGGIESFQNGVSYPAINLTAVNLYNSGYSFEIWSHEGKSPHLHIHNLPITQLNKEERATFKKLFIRKYVPLEYLPYVDFSLTGIHLIAIEWANHWKGCYSIKKLINKWGDKHK